MSADYYKPGDHNVICDRTGMKRKASQCRKEWNGSIVQRESFEQRHPQDFIRAVKDRQQVQDARPPGTDKFLSTNEVTASSL